MKGKKGFSKGEQNPSSIYFKGRNVEKNIVVKCTRTYTPRRRSSILEQLDQGRSKTNVAGNHGINIRTVQRIASTNQNSPQQRGPKLKIVPNSEVEDVLFDIADHEPFARITEINEKFSLETGVVISNETIKRVLYRRNGGEFVFVSPDKSCEDRNLSQIYDMHLGFIEGLNTALKNHKLTLDDIYYQDEFPIFENKLPSKGRTRKGTKLYARSAYRPTRYTCSAVISRSKAVKVSLTKKNADDSVVRTFAIASESRNRNLGGPGLHRLLPRGAFLVWDRLGRSGRAQNPCKQHYNPQIKAKLEEAGINVVMLPPKGHLLNPSELFNNCIQQKVVRWRPPGDPTDEYGHAIVGPRSFDECAMAVNDALDEMKDKPEMFHEFFNKRATGRDFLNRVAKSSVAKNVKARRSRAGIANRQIFSWPARRN